MKNCIMENTIVSIRSKENQDNKGGVGVYMCEEMIALSSFSPALGGYN